MKFKFEKGLEHQDNAIEAVNEMFQNATCTEVQDKTLSSESNPIISFDENKLKQSIDNIQESNSIKTDKKATYSNIFDISMETGTGKTYTYTRMIYELNKNYQLSKFIIVVPSLAIKAGTLKFLKSDDTHKHFRDDYLYSSKLKVYVLESNKSKKKSFPASVREFVREKCNKTIHILVANSHMLSERKGKSMEQHMEQHYDELLLGKYNQPFEAIKAINPITIIDEPHKFKQENKTWKSIKKLGSQYIFRYGATFNKKYENLIYHLTSAQAFNQDLVKGIQVINAKLEHDDDCAIEVQKIDKEMKKVTFSITSSQGKKETKTLSKGDSLSQLHLKIEDLSIDEIKKNEIEFSNGTSFKIKDKFSPYSYNTTIQDYMIDLAISNHFKLEEKLFEGDVKIKPLTLFFFDNISSYRNKGGETPLKDKFEELLKGYMKERLNKTKNEDYKKYLELSLCDISKTHGGYFSKDNTTSDEKIEKEMNDILHDKESLLSLDNPRRFIFSQWTLKEGWDNPNVFQICKLRSSGSETSKLQEVGRGLRLPVNEYMVRIKDEQFYLNYYVDHTEIEFAKKLTDEINQFTDNPSEEEQSTGVKSGKIRNQQERPPITKIRKDKYEQLKPLWELINQNVILEYHIKDEDNLLLKFFTDKDQFKSAILQYDKHKSEKDKNNEEHIIVTTTSNTETMNIESNLTYKEFLQKLAKKMYVNINSLDGALKEMLPEMKNDFNKYYLTEHNIKKVSISFNEFLRNQINKGDSLLSFKYSILRTGSNLHPTKFTNKNGEPCDSINAGNIGQERSNEEVSKSYMFEELFYDSELEKKNIITNIAEVESFTKIPKNSIKIPIPGAHSYSPDFAYIINDNNDNNNKINLIIEAKDKSKADLNDSEKFKIKYGKKFIEALAKDKDSPNIQFVEQLEDKTITDIIRDNVVKNTSDKN